MTVWLKDYTKTKIKTGWDILCFAVKVCLLSLSVVDQSLFVVCHCRLQRCFVERCVRKLLQRSLCTRLVVTSCLRVLQWSSRAKYGSCLPVAGFCMRHLAVLTADSASPLLCGYLGEDLCSNSHLWLNISIN